MGDSSSPTVPTTVLAGSIAKAVNCFTVPTFQKVLKGSKCLVASCERPARRGSLLMGRDQQVACRETRQTKDSVGRKRGP